VLDRLAELAELEAEIEALDDTEALEEDGAKLAD